MLFLLKYLFDGKFFFFKLFSELDDMVFKKVDSLQTNVVLVRALIHQLLNYCVLADDDAVEGNTNSVQSIVQQLLIVLQILDVLLCFRIFALH